MSRTRCALFAAHSVAAVMAGLVAICAGCKPDVKEQSQDRLAVTSPAEGAVFELQKEVFYRRYEDTVSLEPPNSLWCNFSPADYRAGMVTNKYVKGVVGRGTHLKFTKAVVKDFTTHTVNHQYARILTGPYAGDEVLINSLASSPRGSTTFLRELVP